MELNDYISLGAGAIAPLLISAIRGKKWQTWHILLAVFFVALGISSASLWLTNSFTSDNLKDSVALMIATMLPTYTLLWEKTGLNKTLKAWNPLSPKPKRRKRKAKPSTENVDGDGI